jgi:hypothetical protein
MVKCDHDCFNCPYADCIADDELTAEEEIESKQRDEVVRMGGKLRSARDITRRAWLQTPKGKESQKECRRRYLSTKPGAEANRRRALAYYYKHREEILARQKRERAAAPKKVRTRQSKEERNAKARIRYAERYREKKREYYEEHKEEILAKKKARYERQKKEREETVCVVTRISNG